MCKCICVLLVLSVLSLGGCGQYGELYLPDGKEQSQHVQSAQQSVVKPQHQHAKPAEWTFAE